MEWVQCGACSDRGDSCNEAADHDGSHECIDRYGERYQWANEAYRL